MYIHIFPEYPNDKFNKHADRLNFDTSSQYTDTTYIFYYDKVRL